MHRPTIVSVKKLEGGFTLVEVVISIVILSFICVTAYSTLGNLSQSKLLLDDERVVITTADALLGRLTREIQRTTAQVKAPIAPPYNRSLNNPPPFLGESIDGEKNRSTDRITFYASEIGQYLPDAAMRNSGLVQVSYRVEQAPAEDRTDLFYLIRDELPIPPRDPQNPYASLMTFPLTKNIYSLDFTFMQYTPTGPKWSESWGANSQQRRQPDAIKISLTLRSKSGRLFTFVTLVKPLE